MNDYTYGGTSFVIYPSTPAIVDTQIETTTNTKKKKPRTLKERFTIQCVVCATLLALVLFSNFFGNDIFTNATQRISDTITTDDSMAEFFNIESLRNLFNTAREFFTSAPANQTNEPPTVNDIYPSENETYSITPPAVSTDNIAVDPELLDEINSR